MSDSQEPFFDSSMISRVFQFVIAGACLALSACDNGITDAKCDRCDEMRVRTDRAEYRPGSFAAFSVTNRTDEVLRYDWCSVSLVSRTSTEVPFPVSYNPGRRCGFGASTDVVLAHMVPIAPGESIRDSVSVAGGSNQGQYRVHIWLLDAEGLPEGGNPVASNTFDVYPAASSSIQR